MLVSFYCFEAVCRLFYSVFVVLGRQMWIKKALQTRWTMYWMVIGIRFEIVADFER